MRGWQIGCLLGLGVGLFQAMTGGLGLTSLPIDEGILRLAVTMAGGAVLCGTVGFALSTIANGSAEGPPEDALRSLHE